MLQLSHTTSYYWYHGLVDMRKGFDVLCGLMLTGYLQTDGYVAYDVFDRRENITQIHCMAHARRMFNDALDNDQSIAEYAMQEIPKLYAIERNCKEQNLSFNEIKSCAPEAICSCTYCASHIDEGAKCKSHPQKFNWQNTCI